MPVAPYPFRRLPRLTRAEALLSRRAARSLPLARLDDAARAWSALLGAEVSLDALPFETAPAGALESCLADPLVAVVLRGASVRAPLLAVELDPRLAECVVDRALGGPAGTSVGHRVGALDATSRGVLAHVAARALAALDADLRVADVLTSRAALGVALGDDGHVVWPATLRVGDDDGVVRAWLPEAWLARNASPDAALGTHVAHVPVTMVAHGGHASLGAAVLGGLVAGDVLVLDAAGVTRGADGVHGAVVVRAAGTGARPRTVFHCALSGGTLRVTRVERSEEPAMSEGQRRDRDTDGAAAGVALVGDAPVELRVELARFSLSVEDVAALRPGEVVTTGRTIGEAVTLRAGDRAVATGELVDVDGEVGVRILRLAQ